MLRSSKSARILSAAFLIVLAVGLPATAGPYKSVEQYILETLDPEEVRESFVAGAEQLLAEPGRVHDDLGFSFSCDGFILASLSLAGLDVAPILEEGSGVLGLYRYLGQHGALYQNDDPQLGDLIFFRDTYDRNRDGLRNDGVTHVALVRDVLPDGTVEMLHKIRKGVFAGRMNLNQPHQYLDGDSGEILNSYLGRGGRRAKAAGETLTGALFISFGRLLP